MRKERTGSLRPDREEPSGDRKETEESGERTIVWNKDVHARAEQAREELRMLTSKDAQATLAAPDSYKPEELDAAQASEAREETERTLRDNSLRIAEIIQDALDRIAAEERWQARAEQAERLIAETAGATSERKIDAFAPVLLEEPELADYVMNGAKLTPPERAAILRRLEESDPKAFFAAARSSGQEYTSQEKIAIAERIASRDPNLFGEAVEALRMPQTLTIKVMERFDEGERGKLLRALSVPEATDVGEMETLPQRHEAAPEYHDTIPEAEWSPEIQEQRERMRELDRASDDLSAALMEAFPERKRRVKEYMARENALRGKIVDRGKIGKGMFSAKVARIEGSPLPAVYKPSRNESVVNEQGEVQSIISSIEPGEMAWREPLSSLLDRALDFGVIPAAIVRNGPDGLGSVAEWRICKPSTDLPPERFKEPELRHKLMKLALIDLLTRACDNGGPNYGVEANGEIVGYDRGAVHPERLTVFDGIRSGPLREVRGEKIPPEFRVAVREVLDTPAVMAALEKAYAASMKEQAPAALEYLTGKLKEIAENEDMVFPDTDWLSGGPDEISDEQLAQARLARHEFQVRNMMKRLEMKAQRPRRRKNEPTTTSEEATKVD